MKLYLMSPSIVNVMVGDSPKEDVLYLLANVGISSFLPLDRAL